MASPTPEVFAVFDDTGAPITGAAAGMSFTSYTTEAGVAITPQPTITEVGGGFYKFTPTAPPASHGTCYVLSTGHQPAYVTRYVRPEDYNTDQIPDVRNILYGRWQIKVTGPDANKMLFYGPDGTTVILRCSLKDIAGLPTFLNPMERLPV